jgi:8-oxo-dGTP pyrophosphatase MutT (NUDIX family)
MPGQAARKIALDHLPELRKALAEQLRGYRAADAREEEHRLRILGHVESCEAWWHRDTLPGHVTASGFVIDASMERMLLHHHRKLDRWLQLGGHDEGEQDPARTVLREVEEESGLVAAFFGDTPAIFDVDVHPIPEAGGMPGHDHLDVRYLLVADPGQSLRRLEEESRELGWFDFADAIERMNEEGGRRVARKIRDLRAARLAEA